MIGLAACLLVLFNGRVAGISGIAGALVRPRRGDVAWRIAFLGGLIAAPWLYRLAASALAFRIDTGLPALVLAGLLVGIGTRYGAGCTSGHGICGLSRGSPRSLVATLCFMATGIATACVVDFFFRR
jgi:uncharacterized membrane protein YedE/YeeE